MRYLVIWRPETGEEGGMPDPDHTRAMGELVQDMTARGVLIATEPLAERGKGARLRWADGHYSLSEETERAAGYAFLNAASREAVLEQCEAFLKVAGEGTVEIRQILEFGAPPT